MTAQQAQAAARMLRDIAMKQRDCGTQSMMEEWELVSMEELAELLEEQAHADRG